MRIDQVVCHKTITSTIGVLGSQGRLSLHNSGLDEDAALFGPLQI